MILRVNTFHMNRQKIREYLFFWLDFFRSPFQIVFYLKNILNFFNDFNILTIKIKKINIFLIKK
jgi:hypothetical protein